MKRCSWMRVLVLLLLVGFAAAPAFAEMRLTTTGFIDNHVRYSDNLSGDDLTDDSDDAWRARTRARIFFNVAANDFSKAVIGFEIDQVWGQIPDSSTAGFDFGTDNIVVEVKWAYLDIEIPNTPVTLRAGGLPLQADRLKGSCLLLCMDVGGIDVEVAFSPQVVASIYFANTQEDDILESGEDRLGDDYFGGVTLMTELLQDLKANLLFAYQHLGGPDFESTAPATGSTSRLTSLDQTEENRFWIGVEAEWELGNLTISPTAIYGGGQREFSSGGDIDLSTVLIDARVAYVIGPLTITGRFAYTPGNESDDDLGAGGDDIHFWQSIATDTVHRHVEWFEIFGFNIDTTSPSMFDQELSDNEGGGTDPRSLRNNGGFDQFGLIHGALRVDFKATKQATLTGTVGFFSAAETVGPPSIGRGQTTEDTFNFTNDDKYLGTELDVWVRYGLFKGTDVDVYFAYAFIGDALNLCTDATCANTNSAEDVIALGTRIIYRF